ncbi:MAG: hypothetical protein E6Q97_12435 [Desulfurellales bacterium]|nr:MAG: hypothetical protein E6Q97_12435 [Desulfurellales bacterium]
MARKTMTMRSLSMHSTNIHGHRTWAYYRERIGTLGMWSVHDSDREIYPGSRHRKIERVIARHGYPLVTPIYAWYRF